MTPAERIAALEAELAATKKAAVHMMVGMAQGIAQTPEGLETLAAGFSKAAEDAGPVTAGLARKVAEALRLQWMSQSCPQSLTSIGAEPLPEAANDARVLTEDTDDSE